MRHRSPAAGRAVLHGNRTYLLMDEDGQNPGTRIDFCGADYPASGRNIPGCTKRPA